jgi:hypothetical protein
MPHWEQLRKAIDDRGLTPFTAKDGKVAVAQLAKQVQENRAGKDTFDPLMGAHWAIAGNAMRFLEGAGVNPLYLMAGGPEDPVDVSKAGEKYAGRTWPRCPLCYLNLAHELTCTHVKCGLDKERGYDWMIDRASDEALAQARQFGLVP